MHMCLGKLGLSTSYVIFFFLQSRKIRSHVSSRQRACIHGQIENDQLANRNARLIQVML